MRFQIVEIVFEKFIKRRPRHIGELDLRLLARAARRASLGDVLLAASRGLRHLVDGAVAVSRQKTPAERNCPLIDDIALVIDDEVAVAAVRQHYFRDVSHWSLLQGT